MTGKERWREEEEGNIIKRVCVRAIMKEGRREKEEKREERREYQRMEISTIDCERENIKEQSTI